MCQLRNYIRTWLNYRYREFIGETLHDLEKHDMEDIVCSIADLKEKDMMEVQADLEAEFLAWSKSLPSDDPVCPTDAEVDHIFLQDYMEISIDGCPEEHLPEDNQDNMENIH